MAAEKTVTVGVDERAVREKAEADRLARAAAGTVGPEPVKAVPDPVGSPAAGGGQTYTYRVVERAFKENILLDPAVNGLFQSGEVYNSRALVPADDVTKAAVDKLVKEHDQIRNASGPISKEEANALREDIAELRKMLVERGGKVPPAREAKAEDEGKAKK